MEATSERRRSVLQLSRLETLTDVVYALVLWRLFVLLPKPGVDGVEWTGPGAYFAEHALTLIIIVVGLLVTIIYWVQSNALFGNLQKTDGKHTTLSIIQIFSLLVFLFSIRFGTVADAPLVARVFESIAAAMMGLFSIAGWMYASKGRRLLQPDVSDEDAKTIASRIRAEPLTALLTIPFAFIGPWLWEISWLLYPLVTAMVRRRRRMKVQRDAQQ
jgi:uncharacterized membrane protein